MSTLSKELRSQLSRVTLQARSTAEAACTAALENLAVHEKDYRAHMTIEQRQLRNRLRARGRALGDALDERSGKQEITRLAADAAYEHWHRLLFTRFLAENGLLHTDEENGTVPVTLEDCEELAPELGAKDGFDLACRFANKILPGVFRTNDPVFELTLALNDQVALRQLLDSLPRETFTADDSLGWTYQFWQTQRKEEVNKSGKKIGADEISPVTQLFTEDYMVEFLLHNTLGAWWAGKKVMSDQLAVSSEEEARQGVSLPPKNGLPGIDWTYLRFVKDEPKDESEAPSSTDLSVIASATTDHSSWRPAAGEFKGWPRSAAKVTFLDPSMGSGHFPVFALPILARLRMEEENLSAKDAVFAVLRDNIHGLELDARCCQIGAFNLALTAWKLAGYQALPPLHIACCGLAPQAKLADWTALAGDSDKLRRGMERLYKLFEQAPVLGSLINPRASGDGDLLEASFDDLAPLLEKALADEKADDAKQEMAVTAKGVAKAAEILGGEFTLVATNVPYLGRGKQDPFLQDYCGKFHSEAKSDLATCFVDRCLEYTTQHGTTTLVAPQNWLFLKTYSDFRARLLKKNQWPIICRLGPKGFQTPMYDFNTCFVTLTRKSPEFTSAIKGFDVSQGTSAADKADLLLSALPISFSQSSQLLSSDARIVFGQVHTSNLLANHAESVKGLTTGDGGRFILCHWEHPHRIKGWECFQTTVSRTIHCGGSHQIFLWEEGVGEMQMVPGARTYARGAWGTNGILVSQMGSLPVTMYYGCAYDNNCAVIKPAKGEHLAAFWAFCSSSEFSVSVRKIDQSLKPTNAAFEKIPFDLSHWQKIAAEKYPNGLPKPHSDDPTQWLFNGHPQGSEQPLHVAVARLLGYRWPRQTGSSFPDCPALAPDGLESFADEDGIVCLPALNREQPAAARLRALLAAALGSFDEKSLLAATGAKATTLEDWLRDECFEQHCKLFHHRPFLWHLWDGRKDGFSVLVNYHKLDHATLQKLTYTYLGNWIHDQESDAKADKPGAAERLGAAQALQAELAKILEGEAPYDIFVRWKPLAKQAIGWHPDLNDGVRLNIRPFLVAKDMGKKGAGLLRTKPNIKWDKDRGKEPQRPQSDYPWFWCEQDPTTDPTGGKTFTGHRWNDVHLTLEFKKGGKA
jgi:hypothetical protein